jgi:hypothetical protein
MSGLGRRHRRPLSPVRFVARIVRFVARSVRLEIAQGHAASKKRQVCQVYEPSVRFVAKDVRLVARAVRFEKDANPYPLTLIILYSSRHNGRLC